MSSRKRGCPTPDKIKYPTRAAATAALGRPFKGLKAPTRAYWCRGGHFHLTSRA